MKTLQDFLSCRIGQEWYGIDLAAIIEVLHLIAVHELPGSELVGVMTLRNMIMPVVDMRVLFGLPDVSYRLDTPIIAIRTADQRAGLIVDEADNVVHVSADHIESYSHPYTSRIARLDERLLFLLDPAQILRMATTTSA
jgi:purine-binding chemotaxis protein CheW